MRSRRMSRLYAEVRDSAIGDCVSPAMPYRMSVARTVARWETLESMGLVRLRCEFDEGWEPIGCDCGDPRCKSNDPDSEAFGSVGEYRLSGDDEWTHGGSVWGHVGYRNVLDWRENAYIAGVMAETIEAFRDAHKASLARCLVCGR